MEKKRREKTRNRKGRPKPQPKPAAQLSRGPVFLRYGPAFPGPLFSFPGGLVRALEARSRSLAARAVSLCALLLFDPRARPLPHPHPSSSASVLPHRSAQPRFSPPAHPASESSATRALSLTSQARQSALSSSSAGASVSPAVRSHPPDPGCHAPHLQGPRACSALCHSLTEFTPAQPAPLLLEVSPGSDRVRSRIRRAITAPQFPRLARQGSPPPPF